MKQQGVCVCFSGERGLSVGCGSKDSIGGSPGVLKHADGQLLTMSLPRAGALVPLHCGGLPRRRLGSQSGR